jgi:exopolysaccharide biosynthesis WecB/TagA/CpsF family protein
MISGERIELGGCPVDLLGHDDAVAAISLRLAADWGAPLGVVSVNLDHIHHFGTGARWHGAIETGAVDDIDWLNLIDGAPVATQARRMTGEVWPRLAGSDLTGPILGSITTARARVGFFGGMPETQDLLRAKLAAERPGLQISGFWAPSRDDLEDPARSRELALEVNESGTDVLVVGLGKPRQELWIAEHGKESGARVLLAFGAVVDFLAGRVERAPAWVARAGLEWAWRLSREPRRLASRYLVDGPPAYISVHRFASVGTIEAAPLLEPRRPVAVGSSAGRFVTDDSPVDVAAIIVTYNSAGHLAPLLKSLRAECADQRIRVVVADNGSMDGTHGLLAREPDILTVETGGNVGYAQGINAAMSRVGKATSLLILNPDLVVERGAVRTMRDRLDAFGAGIVVPSILDPAGDIYTSLRREPTISRAIGDALVGRRFSRRPEWTSEIDFDPESYRHAHQVDWATGAALLIDRRVADAVGAWDSRFFLYSEETDFFQRVRDEGFTAWYEPAARVRHDQGGSGSSAELSSLMAVNRVRYIRKHRSRRYSALFRAAVVLHETLRAYDAPHRDTLRMLLDEQSWWRRVQCRRAQSVRSSSRLTTKVGSSREPSSRSPPPRGLDGWMWWSPATGAPTTPRKSPPGSRECASFRSTNRRRSPPSTKAIWSRRPGRASTLMPTSKSAPERSPGSSTLSQRMDDSLRDRSSATTPHGHRLSSRPTTERVSGCPSRGRRSGAPVRMP